MTYLTVREVAERLRLSKMTVYRLMESGEMPSLRVGRSFRIPAQDLEHYLSANTTRIEETQ